MIDQLLIMKYSSPVIGRSAARDTSCFVLDLLPPLITLSFSDFNLDMVLLKVGLILLDVFSPLEIKMVLFISYICPGTTYVRTYNIHKRMPEAALVGLIAGKRKKAISEGIYNM